MIQIQMDWSAWVAGALCIIAGFKSCGIPSKTSCYDLQENKKICTFLVHIPVDYLSLSTMSCGLYNTLQSSSTENGICRGLLYNHENFSLQAQTWYLFC